jgi:hypothetical protein
VTPAAGFEGIEIDRAGGPSSVATVTHSLPGRRCSRRSARRCRL